MFGLFKKSPPPADPVFTDIHSHLIPGVDDGVQSMEDALTLIEAFANKGYKKLVTTPHIMSDVYSNNEAHLIRIYHDLKHRLAAKNIDIELLLAAEYYLDDQLYQRMKDGDEHLLTFGDNYLLFETGFMNQPLYLKDFIFQAQSKGYRLVMAHPERYQYMITDTKLIEELHDRGVLFQLNINSLTGYYSKPVKKLAEQLIKNKQVHFIGSDCHNQKHFETLVAARSSKFYQKALALPLLNRTL